MSDKIKKTSDEWRKELTAEQYAVTREAGTEPAFSGAYTDEKAAGTYACVCCGAELFTSDTKFDSGSGWPSFYEPKDERALISNEDRGHGMTRTEVVCQRCDAHLGHVFPDGPLPSGERFCMNSASLRHQPADEVGDEA
jgi:peptide-methionine (R)-S-oxide reductase